ncbi:DUF7667 family protein [Paenibacillus elgii]
MTLKPFHNRLAELWTIEQRRRLTDNEVKEMVHCLHANASYCWRMAGLEDLSFIAYMVNDTEWQREICSEIQALQFGRGI